MAVLTLRAGRDLDAAPQQVKALREALVVLVAHVVEGPHGGGVVGDEGELVAMLALHDLRQPALAGGIEVQLACGRVEPFVAQQLLGLGERDAREGQLGHEHLGAERGADLVAVLSRDDGEHVREPALLE